MAKKWPFFRVTLQNVQLAMSRADMGIARVYSSLVKQKAVRERIFGKLDSEFRRTRRMILLITGQKRLMEHFPGLRKGIDLRNPYLDPISLIQVELLRKIRKKKLGPARLKTQADRDLWNALLLSINGISAGLRSTG